MALEHEVVFKALAVRESWKLTAFQVLPEEAEPHPLLGGFACPSCGAQLLASMPRDATFAPSVPEGLDPALDRSTRSVEHVCPGCRRRFVVELRSGEAPELTALE